MLRCYICLQPAELCVREWSAILCLRDEPGTGPDWKCTFTQLTTPVLEIPFNSPLFVKPQEPLRRRVDKEYEGRCKKGLCQYSSGFSMHDVSRMTNQIKMLSSAVLFNFKARWKGNIPFVFQLSIENLLTFAMKFTVVLATNLKENYYTPYSYMRNRSIRNKCWDGRKT